MCAVINHTQTPDLEPFKAVSDPAEAEADAALSLLDNIEALAAEVDNFSEAEMAAADLQVRGWCMRGVVWGVVCVCGQCCWEAT